MCAFLNVAFVLFATLPQSNTLRIGDQGAIELLTALAEGPARSSLTRLDLTSNSVGDVGASALASALMPRSGGCSSEEGSSCMLVPAVAELLLAHNVIRDEGARSFIRVLRVNRALRLLDLRSNDIDRTEDLKKVNSSCSLRLDLQFKDLDP